MSKRKVPCEIISQSKISDDIFSMVFKNKEMAEEARPGQFVALYTADPSKLLPRPISICDVNKQKGTIRLVYRVAGGGTKLFSSLKAGDSIEVMGPLGNGYVIDAEEPVLMGGGIGIPPMLYLAKSFYERGVAKGNINVILGFRDKGFLIDDFKKYATVHITSDAGTIGMKGNVIDLVKQENITGDMIYACGPTPMLKGVKKFAFLEDIPAQISLEEKMACGIGACLACVCKSAETDEHFHTNTKRVCKDGPVFYAEEVEL